LMAQPWLKPSMKKKLEEAKAILDALPRSSSVAIASPENLARELFTHKGAGTIIRAGERVRRYESLDGIDRDRLRALLEDSFGRKLHLDYFDKKPFFRVYLADSYRAVAILTLEEGIPYLDKFAVTSDAQGDGIGASLWQHMAADNRQLFWRARLDNEVNPWYFARATGTHKTDKWIVFWSGLQDFDVIQRCVDRALAMPASLKAHGEVPPSTGASS
jgi:bifunctional N-acetylglutamate synthase/kinase